MKKTLLVLALVAATCTAQAQNRYEPRHFDRYQGGGSRGGWLIPAIIGGVLVYGATRAAEPTPPPAPVYVAPPPPPVVSETCPSWQHPVYSHVRVQDNWGNIREEYQFAGCVQ